MYYKRRDNRSNNSLPVGDILSKIINRPELRNGLLETRVIKAWPKVMGTSVARITTQLYFKNGYLYVNLNSSVIRSELILHKERIMSALNKEAGGKIVYGIVFR